MNRVKVVNDPADLVSIFRAVDTEVKMQLLKEISLEWMTTTEVADKYGKKGTEALNFFEKIHLVETRWQREGTDTTKSYHAYYTGVHINITTSLYEISDIIAAAVLSDRKFSTFEKKVTELIGDGDGVFSGDVEETLGLSKSMLKALIKRSGKMNYRGHRIEMIPE